MYNSFTNYPFSLHVSRAPFITLRRRGEAIKERRQLSK